jgi:hypothetical protein
MAVRPKRKNPVSTRPVYLPRVPARELRETAKAGAAKEDSGLRVYADGTTVDFDIKGLAERLGGSVAGELVASLAGRPQSEVRDEVAALARRVASARIRDAEKQEYRMLPLRGEVDHEEARFRARTLPEYEDRETHVPPSDALYDGAEVQAAYRDLLASDDGGTTNVVVTDRRIACWDEKARSWTPAAVLPGTPVLASISAEGTPAAPDALAEEIGGTLR